MNNKPHVCQESRTCCCSCQALEPNEDCPIHGYPWPPKCEICGRFIRRPKQMPYVEADERFLD